MSSFECFLRYFQTRITTTKFKHITLTPIQILFFTLWSTPSFGMLLSKLSNRNTKVCTSSIRMISFFLCESFTSYNVSNNATLRPYGQGKRVGGGRGGVVNQMWTDLDRGRGGPNNSKLQTSFMDDSQMKVIVWMKVIPCFIIVFQPLTSGFLAPIVPFYIITYT